MCIFVTEHGHTFIKRQTTKVWRKTVKELKKQQQRRHREGVGKRVSKVNGIGKEYEVAQRPSGSTDHQERNV